MGYIFYYWLKKVLSLLSRVLKNLRENCGFTQQQVANILNIDRSTYSYYETGKTVPDINTVIKLSKIFNVSYTEMFEYEEKKYSPKFSDISSVDKDIILKYGRKGNYQIYDLSKDEQEIIMGYRLLSKENQNKILKEIYLQTKEISNRNKNK